LGKGNLRGDNSGTERGWWRKICRITKKVSGRGIGKKKDSRERGQSNFGSTTPLENKKISINSLK